jgi:Mg2+-importing ATPase
MKFSDYTAKNIKETLDILKSSEKGLSEKEAEDRLKVYGFNEVKGKKVGLFDTFFRQFKSPFFYLLFIASIIAFLIGEKIDGLVILTFIFVNVLVGFFQEARAEKAVSLLKKYIPSKIRVLRQGKEKIIDKNLLVPGDVALLAAGDIIPADLRILKIENFLIDESVLTGESMPVPKIVENLSKEAGEIFEAKNIAFAGTSAISGKAEGIVIGTGRQTALGKVTKLVSGIKRESVYEKDLLNFSRIILRIVVITITFVFLANLIIKGPAGFFVFSLFSLALIVSIIPEALPVVVTFALSEGALKLARAKVVVKRLSSVEDLGDIEVLCTDKTGTLTENKLSLAKISAADQEKCLLYGLLSSSYIKEEIKSGLNPFDLALFEKTSQKIRQSLKEFKEISEMPFDPVRLRNNVIVEDRRGNLILIVKGAPETILKISSTLEGNLERGEIEREVEKEGREGKRVLAVAYKIIDKKDISRTDEKDLIFLGYFSFFDFLKKTAKEAIQLARKLGLKIKILTGDSKEVAGLVAKEVDLIQDPQQVILGETLDSLSKEEFEKSCQEFSVFARVSPQTKYEIVKALQKKSEVGFMGDGINDAPALKMANVAIAVPGATNISQEVSDVILLEKDLRVIVAGISQGRNIFSNINKYIKCALASNFGNFYSIAVISLFIPFLPMLPVQVLLGNLLSDFPLISIVTDRVDTEEIRKPRMYQLNKVLSLVILLALVSTIFDFIFFGIFYKAQPALIQTLWFIESIFTEILLIFAIRTRHFFLKTKRPGFLLLTLTILDAILIVLLPFTNFGKTAFHFISPPIPSLLIVFSLVISYFIISEIVKLIYFRYWWRIKPQHQ